LDKTSSTQSHDILHHL